MTFGNDHDLFKEKEVRSRFKKRKAEKESTIDRN